MTIRITLLGRFEVCCGRQPIPGDAWGRRHAAALVKLLALNPGRRLHREQVIDALWPDDTLDAAVPKLHKAAHFARKATGDNTTIVLRDETVALFPNRAVIVDVQLFEIAAVDALRSQDDTQLRLALQSCAGDLLPDDLYEAWADGPRRRVHQLRVELLRGLGQWEDLVRLDATDEEAHLEVIRDLAGRGDRHGALRQFERLDRALAHELGVGPGPEALALRDELLATAPFDRNAGGPPAHRPGGAHGLIGRISERRLVETFLADADRGRGGTLVLSGPAGVGKSALLAWTRAEAEARGWRTGHGVAAAVEGAWAYAPVLEAIADLCRRHPTLLGGLDDGYRTEIDRGLAGTDLEWSGEGGHQRLFVAVAELLRLASVNRGAMLLLDDLHEADEASLRLLHYVGRCAVTERIALVVAHRPAPLRAGFEEIRGSLISRGAAVVHDVAPLLSADAAALVERIQPGTPADVAARIVELARGLPFAVVELSRRASAPAWEQSAELFPLTGLSLRTRDILQRVAVLGTTFATDEFVALADLPDDQAFMHLDQAISAGVIEHTGAHYRFRHGLVRDGLIRDVAPHRRARIHRDAAIRLEALGASPARIGHHLVAAGEPAAAGPYVIRAAEREAAIGAYRDALDLIETIQAHVDGDVRGRAMWLRADLLLALGDPSAIAAYRQALPTAVGEDRRLLRARLARAAIVAGDLDTAVAALEDVELNGGAADGDILLARGQVAFFTGNIDAAWHIAEKARSLVQGGDQSWQVLDLVALQGLLSHSRGEWFDRMRTELQRTRQSPELALAIFDAYLCPAEYLLYGSTPYAEVIDLARSLRETAHRAGALRAVAFACALMGEAALLAGDLDMAERELGEAVELHRDIAAASGEAHSLQRLAEVHLAKGDRSEAMRLLQRALPLARWSAISLHLLQRIFGTMIRAVPDPVAARAVVDRAESTLGTEDQCVFCDIMLAVPAAIACADVGDLDHAQHHLQVAERYVGLWDGTSWQAAVLEARAHLADHSGDTAEAQRLRTEAGALFDRAGQPLDAARCRSAPAA